MISDAELCMLEQMCYIDGNLLAAIGKITSKKSDRHNMKKTWSAMEHTTLSDVLEKMGFTDEALGKLSTMAYSEIPYGFMSGFLCGNLILLNGYRLCLFL